MRTLGPGSVSSFLKIVLDVTYVALWAALGMLVLAVAALLVLAPFNGGVVHLPLGPAVHMQLDGAHPRADLTGKAPVVAGLVFIVALYAGALVIILNRLRRVFETLTRGDPFQPENVGRLQMVGLTLIALEGLGHILHAAVRWIEPRPIRHAGFSIDLTSLFAILVVFVLAEVFREGARLRLDAELTI